MADEIEFMYARHNATRKIVDTIRQWISVGFTTKEILSAFCLAQSIENGDAPASIEVTNGP